MTNYFAPRAEVRITGLTLASDVSNHIVSVSYDNNVEMADMFTVVLRNPDNQLTDSPLFDLGKSVEIHMGYGDSALEPMMLGEITSVSPSFPAAGGPTLTVSGYDRSFRMRHDEPSRKPFQHMTDSAIVAQIAGEAGLIPVIDPSAFYHEKIQPTGTDMAFLKERAKANFFETYVHWDRLYFQFPRPQTKQFDLRWGQNLTSFQPRLSSAAMAGLQVVRGWDEELAQAIVAFAMGGSISLDNITEKLGSEALSLIASWGRRANRDSSLDSSADAATFAKSLLAELLEGMYEGSGTTIGIPELRANEFVAIGGVGKRFSGAYRLKKVVHTLDDSGYRTAFEVTQQSGASLLQLLRKTLTDLPSPNRQRKFYGVAVGKVTSNTDEKQRGRVKVSFPWFGEDHESGWARCASPMASKDGKGIYFLPDVDDEVLVAFDQGNFSKPVVIGSLWNGKNRPPENNSEHTNAKRHIKTPGGHALSFDDSKGGETVTLHHSTGAEIVIKPDGTVSIAAKGNLDINAKGNVNITANDGNGAVMVRAKTMDVTG
ncbi:VgrG-related protein [soil metagenome]